MEGSLFCSYGPPIALKAEKRKEENKKLLFLYLVKNNILYFKP